MSLQQLAQQGRFGDSMLAHINPQEAALLKALGGSGTINPKTGLREYWGFDSFFSSIADPIQTAINQVGDIGQGAIDTVEDVGSQADDFVNTQVPGGWPAVAAVVGATTGLPGGETFGSLDAGPGAYDISAYLPSNVNASGLGSLIADDGTTAGILEAGAESPNTIYGQGEGAFPGTEPGKVAMDQSMTNMGIPSLSGLSKLLNGAKNFLSNPLFGDLTGGGALLGGLGIAGLINMMKEDNKRFGTPGRKDYTGGDLAKLKYAASSFSPTVADPSRFRPGAGVKTLAQGGTTQRPQLTSRAKLAAMDPYQRAIAEMNNAAYNARMPSAMKAPATGITQLGQFAGGGSVEQMSNANAVGANTGFPMADIQRGAYATPYQQPISQNVLTGAGDTRVDPYTGQERLAGGGIANLGGYSDGGRLLRGPGDGVSDSIPAVIGNKQPARLADGEFVVPARIVSELGNGSTEAGARQLYAMMDRIQKARGKTTGKGKMAKDTKASKYLPA